MDDPENPYFPDVIEKYFARPNNDNFENLTFFQYHFVYRIERQKRKSKALSWKDGLGYFVYARNKVSLYISLYTLIKQLLANSILLFLCSPASYEQLVDDCAMERAFSL